MSAFGLRFLGHLNRPVLSDEYEGWKGDTEREVDWQSGCCVLLRGDLLKKLGGFDEQFFYQFEEVDLCHRYWVRDTVSDSLQKFPSLTWAANRWGAFRCGSPSKSAVTGTATFMSPVEHEVLAGTAG